MPLMIAKKRHVYGGRARDVGEKFEVEGRYVRFEKMSGNAEIAEGKKPEAVDQAVDPDPVDQPKRRGRYKTRDLSESAVTNTAMVSEAAGTVVAGVEQQGKEAAVDSSADAKEVAAAKAGVVPAEPVSSIPEQQPLHPLPAPPPPPTPSGPTPLEQAQADAKANALAAARERIAARRSS